MCTLHTKSMLRYSYDATSQYYIIYRITNRNRTESGIGASSSSEQSIILQNNNNNNTRLFWYSAAVANAIYIYIQYAQSILLVDDIKVRTKQRSSNLHWLDMSYIGKYYELYIQMLSAVVSCAFTNI